jgi:hypothetical protein
MSKMKLKNDYLTVQYNYKQGFDKSIPDSLKPINKDWIIEEKQDTFSIKYLYSKGDWLILDTIKYKNKESELYGI